MDYTINWEDKPGIRPRGAYLALGGKENREWWMKRKIAEIDCELAPFDMKRFFIQEPEVVVEKGIGVGSIKRLARISRGIFQPIDISEYMHEYEKEIPPELRQLHYTESSFWRASRKEPASRFILSLRMRGMSLRYIPLRTISNSDQLCVK